ncbi:hypothetical protein BFG60_3840 [Microcystis aeruginosa NIES-98]|nr:hypothetical protein BFG60_3840 [Microcystis aeruginosa NIES-98]
MTWEQFPVDDSENILQLPDHLFFVVVALLRLKPLLILLAIA